MTDTNRPFSPLPWKPDGSSYRDSTGYFIGTAWTSAEAAFIVRAVNSHSTLLQLVKDAAQALALIGHSSTLDLERDMEQAITNIEGKGSYVSTSRS